MTQSIYTVILEAENIEPLPISTRAQSQLDAIVKATQEVVKHIPAGKNWKTVAVYKEVAI